MKTEKIDEIAKKIGKQERTIEQPSILIKVIKKILKIIK
jgi:hypothetical protein